MKKNLLITAVILLTAVLTISAQDTLKVNFKPSGTVNETGWDSVLVADKTSFGAGAQTFIAFGGAVFVEPVWLTSPDASNTRAIARTTNEYSGSLQSMLSTFIAADSRTTNDADAIGVKISGLPAGKYVFNSYHHDYRDQLGSFTVSVSVNSTEVETVDNPVMISHSIDYDKFVATYGAIEDEDKAAEYVKHWVVASLDSVTQFTSGVIVSEGTSDEILVTFTNVLGTDAEMSHNEKLVLINGFTLAESSNVGTIDSKATMSPEIMVVSELGGNLLITSDSQMASVKLFNIAGQLVNEINNVGNKAEFNNLRKGLYLVRVVSTNGEISSKKIITK